MDEIRSLVQSRSRSDLKRFLAENLDDNDNTKRQKPNGTGNGSGTHLDYEAFRHRLQTFRPLMWSSVNPISPVECAINGYYLIAADLVKCAGCGNVAYGKMAAGATSDSKIYERHAENLRKRLKKHAEFCPWAQVSSPPDFGLELDVDNKFDLQKSMEASKVFGERALPVFTTRTKRKIFGEDADELLAFLIEGDVDGVSESAALLAVCGWTVTGSSMVPLMSCSKCRRDCGAWCFRSVADGVNSAGVEIFADSDEEKARETSNGICEEVANEEVNSIVREVVDEADKRRFGAVSNADQEGVGAVSDGGDESLSFKEWIPNPVQVQNEAVKASSQNVEQEQQDVDEDADERRVSDVGDESVDENAATEGEDGDSSENVDSREQSDVEEGKSEEDQSDADVQNPLQLNQEDIETEPENSQQGFDNVERVEEEQEDEEDEDIDSRDSVEDVEEEDDDRSSSSYEEVIDNDVDSEAETECEEESESVVARINPPTESGSDSDSNEVTTGQVNPQSVSNSQDSDVICLSSDDEDANLPGNVDGTYDVDSLDAASHPLKPYFHPIESHLPWCPWAAGFARIVEKMKAEMKKSEAVTENMATSAMSPPEIGRGNNGDGGDRAESPDGEQRLLQVRKLLDA